LGKGVGNTAARSPSEEAFVDGFVSARSCIVQRAERRSREYLTEAEVERLIKAAADNRQGHRDATMILVTFRHGLRTAEVTRLRWESQCPFGGHF
jgi:integrase